MARKLFISILVIFILIFTACGYEEQFKYEFPISRVDMEKVLDKQNLNWFIKEIGVFEEAQKNIITLTNDDNIIFAIGFQDDEGRNVLDITWFLPKEITTDKFNEFYNKELPELFELVGIFYGSKREMDKGLNEFLNYYLNNESNYKNGVYWTKRIGNDHLKLVIRPDKPYNDDINRVGQLLVLPHESYEHFLRLRNENLKNINGTDSGIKLSECTISEMLDFEYPDDGGLFARYFIVRGHIKDIKEIKTVPMSLQSIDTRYTKPNKDKYLSGKLIDDTGSIDIFLQTTSLDKNELKLEREHQVMMYHYENNPIFIVINSALTD